ncbi:TonB-dependent receptor plug domain-containing protein [Novosphingobium humi]|uniref:TonB-dependent receptor plug domain-containing protein n=1 Tax=Novosphingobium humi TaxID=2282397 RepID=UPI0025B1F876|nr:TonB-dependent receptor [Novosphingobium humi]WJS99877.1 TonB-dependent receptor [Novosphingobium humi]
MRGSILASASSLCLGLLLMPQTAWAQTGDTPQANAAEAIVVTGSRIARRDYVAQSPIVTTSRQMIENTGTATIDAALLQMPQFQPGSGGFTNSSSGGAGIGQSTLNLRGLTAVRTLVLLDGRRLQPGNASNVIDINSLPTSAISGTEVITGGASATYGSDAIAGVVNFKLYHHFEGLRIDAQSGISERGDAASRQISAITGTKFADGKGSIMLAGEYSDRGGLTYRDRPFSTPSGSYNATLPNAAYVVSGSNLPSQAAVNGVYANYGIPAGTVARTVQQGVNGDGTLFVNNTANAYNYRADNAACMYQSGTLVRYDGLCTNTLQLPLTRYAFLGRAEYEVSPSLKLFVQGQFARSISEAQGSHPQLASAGSSSFTIPMSNPFIPADLRTLLQSRPNPNATFEITKRIVDGGVRHYRDVSNTYQIVAGAEGVIPGINWNFELYGSHGRTSFTDTSYDGSYSLSAIRQLVNAADGGASQCTGGLNLFSNAPISASCLSFIQRKTLSTTSIGQDELAANLTGSLFKLPAGEVKVALSGNYRSNTFTSNPDPLLQIGDIAAVNGIPAIHGSTKVSEAAVEVLVPVLADLPLIKALNLTGGYRYSHYNLFGGVSTYKLSADWRIADPLLLRGGYQKAVRAPNIGELFLPASAGVANLGTLGDPCTATSSYRTGANAASVRSLCIASGVPSSLVDSFNGAAAIPATTQGNVNLRPEKADSYTFGAVFQPTFAGAAFRRMNLSVDYYQMNINQAISTIDVPTSMAKCFNSDGSNPTYDANNLYCQNVLRNTSTGQIANSYQALLNIGAIKTAGIDVAFDWSIPFEALKMGPGSFDVNFTLNYLDTFKIQASPTSPFQEAAGTIVGPSSTGQSYAKWKYSGTFIANRGKVSLGLRWRHISSFKDSSAITNPATTVPGTPAYDYFDIIGRLKVTDRFELRGGITNVGDRNPPAVQGTSGMTNMGIYDVIRRSFYLGFKATL